ncbi:MAG: D-glycerate dehydrogenase [Pseudomonadota bacterium]
MRNVKKVLITRKWPEAVEAKLSSLYDVTLNENDQPMNVADFRDALMTHDAVCPTVTDKMGPEVFKGLDNPRCKVLGNYGVGYTHIDTQAANEAGITVTNTPDVLSECTADIALTLMLMAARRAGEGERELRAGQWTGWRPTHMVGQKMSGKTLGIVGFGRIGQETARRAKFGFGMRVMVQNRSLVNPYILKQTSAQQYRSLEEMLPHVDYLSLHCPGGDANRGLISTKELKAMKSSAILINTARGEVVDDLALIHALKTGEIAAAGLDVFDGEPNVNPGYLDCENAVLLPHLGSATAETREGMGFRVMDNLRQFFDGETPQDKVA